ncbi:cupin domain-containing protein [Actinoallomurus purpureus]|uniref:cupin domain-containing protein n=1 Tax=Actinoallomurus purpureus TaxID=478114 RepID=UPI002093748F|nr:cupin domain-containing protein [Actinoallomurus purpureus]MCO6009841.1 cupin domain-containing protein [Actinoallomurus purpureus]
MRKLSLEASAREQLDKALSDTAGRSATTVYGGHEHALRQTLIALAADTTMDEHVSPGEATVHVLRGRVRLVAGGDSWEGRTGDLIAVPDARHSVEALEDSVFLLTVVKLREGT